MTLWDTVYGSAGHEACLTSPEGPGSSSWHSKDHSEKYQLNTEETLSSEALALPYSVPEWLPFPHPFQMKLSFLLPCNSTEHSTFNNEEKCKRENEKSAIFYYYQYIPLISTFCYYQHFGV